MGSTGGTNYQYNIILTINTFTLLSNSFHTSELQLEGITASLIDYAEKHNSNYDKGSICIYCDNLKAVKISNRDKTTIGIKK